MSDTPKEPEIRQGRSLTKSWVWIVPILALLVAASLLLSVWIKSGPVITISFDSVSGIEVGQTKLRYRDVIIGEVSDIRVDTDRSHVLVDVQLKREGSEYITQDSSKFWVVRPEISMAGVSGLETIISGAYISVDAANTIGKDKATYKFKGLNNPPSILNGENGTTFTLHTDSLQSVGVGTKIYYRRLEVGRVADVAMSADGRSVDMSIFVAKPYDKFVTNDTRFWNDSGVDMSLSPDGVQLRTGGLAALISGGIAFVQADEDTSYDGEFDNTPAKPGTKFELFNTREDALAEPDDDPFQIEMRFKQSVRGLKVGANVDFLGINVGKVIDIDLEYDNERRRFYTSVRADVFPNRFSDEYKNRAQSHDQYAGIANSIFDPLIKHGLRAQLKAANLLTGQQFISLEFFSSADAEKSQDIGHLETREYLIPTMSSDLDRIQEQITGILTKFDAIPLDKIGDELLNNLRSLDKFINKLSQDTAPETKRTLSAIQISLEKINGLLDTDAPLVSNFQGTLQNITDAAKALRMLADTIQAQPDTLLKGHAEDRLH